MLMPGPVPLGSIVKLRVPTMSLSQLGFKAGDLFKVIDNPSNNRVHVREPHTGHEIILAKWYFIPVTPLELLARECI